MTQESQTSRHVWNITVESDWLTTIELGLLFVMLCLLFVRDIRDFIWGHFAGPVHIQMNYWSISNKVFAGIAAIYCFIFAFTFTRKPVKIACALMAIKLAGFALLSCFSISLSMRHTVAVSGLIVSQIALVIFLVAIAQWFKSVIRWDTPSELRGGDD
ncbi:MAG: hypothetical protein ACLQBK_01535 [Candidatus Sulfotelmatobacter sp.]